MKSFVKKSFIGLMLLICSAFCASALFSEDSQFPVYYQPDIKVKIDGNNADWPKTVPFIMESYTQIRSGKWRNAGESGYKVWAFFDKENLYLYSVVTDSTPCLNPYQGSNINQGDCLEVYLGFHKKKKINMTSQDHHFGIALTPGQAKTWIWDLNKELTGQETAVIKNDSGCILEAKIPLKNFGPVEIKDGDPVWIDFAGDDWNGTKDKVTGLVWSGNNPAIEVNPSFWKKAVISADPKVFLGTFILMPEGFSTARYHRIYVMFNGLPWQGEIKMGEDKYQTDTEGGISLEYDPNTMSEMNLTVNYVAINKKLEKSRESSAGINLTPVKNIKVNQLGYLPKDKKIFVLTDNEENLSSKDFTVMTTDGKVAFKGTLTDPSIDFSTSDTNYYGDFTALTNTGKYIIKIADFEDSYPFEINDDILKRLFYTTTRSYYLQRCGIDINDTISKIVHPACHLKDGYLHENPDQYVNTTGGWHDAGDYGKYMATAGVTTAELLMLYEISPDTFKNFSLDIPESGNGIPDLINEVKYELDWMLKMQDKDGGVYHKVNTKDFPGNIPPQNDNGLRLIYEKGTADTAIYAGSMAVAYRVFAKIDPKYAEVLKKASLNAINFLIKHKSETLWPMNDKTGAYLTGNVNDEIYWAFAETYRMTGNDKYLKTSLQYTPRFLEYSPISWDDLSSLAIYALLKADKTPKTLKTKLLALVKSSCEWTMKNYRKNGYKVFLGGSEYKWASNKTDLAFAMNLILANQFLPNKEYIDAARSQLNYILGVNTLSKCFITEIGSNGVKYPHHRIVQSLFVPVPGLLVGGPNSSAEDGTYPSGLGAKGYFDSFVSFSCNEYAIDYNAPLVFVTGYFMIQDNK